MKWGNPHIARNVLLFIASVILMAILILLFANSASAKWGYEQEGDVRKASRQFVRDLKTQGIDATFRFYEDGSWEIVGCVSDGLCWD